MGRYVFAGASSKIAAAAAEALHAEGHTVTAISTKQTTEGYDEAYTVENYHGSTYPTLDGLINGLVYFPGTINLKPFHRFSQADFVRDYEINCLGAIAFLQQYYTQLKSATNGSVVLVSSVAATTGMPFHASIAMAKSALESLTRSLAAEWAGAIRVNCVAPSLTNTPIGDKFLNTPEKLEAAEKRNPMKKVGTPAEVASAITYLLSDKASWVTGQIFHIDGGMGNLK